MVGCSLAVRAETMMHPTVHSCVGNWPCRAYSERRPQHLLLVAIGHTLFQVVPNAKHDANTFHDHWPYLYRVTGPGIGLLYGAPLGCSLNA